MDASCCVARKIFLSAASASSRARTLDSRPTTNGVIMRGKMTTSRMGIMGSFLDSYFSFDVVTQSPWGEKAKRDRLNRFYIEQRVSGNDISASRQLNSESLNHKGHEGTQRKSGVPLRLFVSFVVN